jgi:type II secretory pathway pseudopilin PulG
MTLRLAQVNGGASRAAFTLMEIMVAFLIFGMTVSGLIYGYVQANRMAELSSMSLAAQSYASQGLEQARSAQWNSQGWPVANGPGTDDEIPLSPSGVATNGTYTYLQTDFLDVPSTGAQIPITNYVTITNISVNPPLRQIRSDCVWTFPLDGILCTNTVITLRAPDE